MSSRADRWLGSLVALLGVVVAVGAFGIDAGVGYDRIGPRAVPYGVALGLIGLGALLVVSSVRAVRRPDSPAPAVPRRAAVLLGIAVVGFLALADRLGFIAAAGFQFWVVARAFDERRPWRDAIVAIALSLVVYVAFSRGLGLALPAALIEGWIP